MKFIDWLILREEEVVTATVASTPSDPLSSKSVTLSGGEAQVGKSTDCRNCAKDFYKNWYYTKKRKKR